MGRNIEIKARVGGVGPEPEALRRRVAELADEGPSILEQRDTFFANARGRLKLREFGDGSKAELIAYQRPDARDPQASDYVLAPVDEPGPLIEALNRAYGIVGVVSKRRILYMIGQTRVHLDEVAGLGDFMELEVVLREDQSEAEGRQIAEALMERLGIPGENLIAEAYVDLLGKDLLGKDLPRKG